MIYLKVNKKSIEIPQGWDEITYGQYLQLINLTTDVSVIQLLTGLPLSYIVGNESKYLPYLEWLKIDIN